jgi:hypothetical protein
LNTYCANATRSLLSLFYADLVTEQLADRAVEVMRGLGISRPGPIAVGLNALAPTHSAARASLLASLPPRELCDFRLWPNADMAKCNLNVRSSEGSRHKPNLARWPWNNHFNGSIGSPFDATPAPASDVTASLDYLCNILGNVICPMLQRVEGHNANRVVQSSG